MAISSDTRSSGYWWFIKVEWNWTRTDFNSFLHTVCSYMAEIVTNSVSQVCDNVSYRECNILNCCLTHFEMQQMWVCMHVLALHKDTFEIVVCSTACHITVKTSHKKCVKIVTNITCDSFVTPHMESQVDRNCGIQYNRKCVLFCLLHTLTNVVYCIYCTEYVHTALM